MRETIKKVNKPRRSRPKGFIDSDSEEVEEIAADQEIEEEKLKPEVQASFGFNQITF